ncbi:MAG: ABC transporter ATP-binding protein [Methylococcales bacterium]|jgi:peptide/nickel transport system ATP-binding protein|nr:ABC transporter ATP-binding protein [Methylococcales bacterium]MBT7443982.1 ABC transporter ATP-binding protein [Methylococcales bacterium]
MPLLDIHNLTASFSTNQGPVRVLDQVSLSIKAGETLALLGESGCGKSMTALAIMRLLPDNGRINQGKITLNEQSLLSLSERQMRNVRGKRIAMIFQEPMTALNPVMSVGQQIEEALHTHTKLNRDNRKARTIELLTDVGIPAPEQRYHEYPHQLSGGLKQRVVIATALACEPDLIIADEPTTALDVTIQAQVLLQLKKLQKSNHLSILLITHDLGIVRQIADHIAVMYAGKIIETATKDTFFKQPAHPYSQHLFKALPDPNKRDHALSVIRGQVPSLNQTFTQCRFIDRCHYAQQTCLDELPPWLQVTAEQSVRCHRGFDAQQDSQEIEQHQSATLSNAPLLSVNNLQVHFPIRSGLLKKITGYVYAVDGVSITLHKGKTFALVGESGCGKTTVGKALLQLIPNTGGEINFQGTNLSTLSARQLKPYRAAQQIIFQDPFSSLNPKRTIGQTLLEGLQAQNIGDSPQQQLNIATQWIKKVGLPEDTLQRFPHEFSGGQRQRVGIARALSVNPQLIVCDEPTSALDVSIQAQILNLLKALQIELNLAYLFISHDLAVVSYLADTIAVMYLGRIVEQGKTEDILHNPKHPYTQALLNAIPDIKTGRLDEQQVLQGDVPSPIKPPNGCYFHPRCPQAQSTCQQNYPMKTSISDEHLVYCHLAI